jgi:uncharacterized protein with PIN domain
LILLALGLATAAIENCKTEDADTCSECNAEFKLVENACVADDHCTTPNADDASICDDCDDGYSLGTDTNAGKCI